MKPRLVLWSDAVSQIISSIKDRSISTVHGFDEIDDGQSMSTCPMEDPPISVIREDGSPAKAGRPRVARCPGLNRGECFVRYKALITYPQTLSNHSILYRHSTQVVFEFISVLIFY